MRRSSTEVLKEYSDGAGLPERASEELSSVSSIAMLRLVTRRMSCRALNSTCS